MVILADSNASGETSEKSSPRLSFELALPGPPRGQADLHHGTV